MTTSCVTRDVTDTNEGCIDGAVVGLDGAIVGRTVGVREMVGETVEPKDGALVVGKALGVKLGLCDGTTLGRPVGSLVGGPVGRIGFTRKPTNENDVLLNPVVAIQPAQ